MTYGFTIQSLKAKLVRHPIEDAFCIEGNVFCVADGVTRDLRNGRAAVKNLRGAAEIFFYYPRPSYAKNIADLFCSGSPCLLKSFDVGDCSAIEKTMFYVNDSSLKGFNQHIGMTPETVDYLQKDYAGCTAAVAVENKNSINYGFICDSGVAILDDKENLRFKTPDEGPHSPEKRKYLNKIVEENGGWDNSNVRIAIRRDYRNKPNQEYSFGVLTGQKEAMHYVRAGTEEFKSNETLLVYTDGAPIFNSYEDIRGDFVDAVRRGESEVKRFCKKNVSTEGTLIVSKR